ncbi:MAG: carboxylesterase family protein [Saprospiraceae bacterium]|nr:carboxylesterase family protein [Saprospiraceae bacterium]
MKLLLILLLCLLGLNLAKNYAQSNNTFAVQAKTENGIVEGSYDVGENLSMYFGIPFAKPPVGELRWKAPQPLSDWSGIKGTKHFGPRSVQSNVFGDMRFRSDGISEDCLYLNIWTPTNRTTKNLPVLVYFYGGGFVAGDGSEPRYDGASMAKKGMVTVTVNYRLNIFGFFAHPELSAESPYKASGNYGLMDQAAALQWVYSNIAAFGGDPKKITIAGESAGSISVCAQMVSPLARDLIAGAIGESGAGIKPTLAPVPLHEAEQEGLEFATKAGYPTLAQLRSLSTKDVYDIYQESQRFGFPTVVDGYFYPKTVPEIFDAGEQAKVPLLLGWNSAEIPGMAFMQGLPYTEEAYLKKVKETYPNDHAQVLKLYPYGSKEVIELSATALASDRFIVYSTWKWFDLHRKNSDQPVYRYLYSKLRPPLKDVEMADALAGGTVRKSEVTAAEPKPVGAPHACEIEYCMGNLHLMTERAWQPEDFEVSKTMQQYFANFILTGNPNGQDLPEWPSAQADDQTPPVMIIDVVSKSIDAKDDTRYQFLDRSYGN